MIESYKSFSEDDGDLRRYYFISIGKSEITKVVEFTPIEKDLVNLAMGDLMNDYSIDDKVKSNNGDMRKVFATVASCFVAYIKDRPNTKIILKGNTSTKSALYQRLIIRYLEELKDAYYLEGYREHRFEEFNKNHNYDYLRISIKADLENENLSS